MKKGLGVLFFICSLFVLAGCSLISEVSTSSNPAQGMQVATLSGTPGGNTLFPTAATVPYATAMVPGSEEPFILMKDDFSNPNSGWETYSGEYGTAGYEQGGYLVSAIISKEYNWGVAGVNFDNVRIEVDATVLVAPGNLEDGFGVDCRIQDNGDGYGFRIGSDGMAEIVLFSDGESIALYEWTESAAVRVNGATNHITAICEGSHLSLLVNDEFVAEVVDDTFSTGDLALSAISYSDDPVEVLFDDIIVQSIGNAYEYEDGEMYPVNIINTSGYEVCVLYITSPISDYWGDSWINPSKPMAAGTTLTIDENDNAIVDVLARTCDSLRLLEVYNVDVSASNTIVINDPVLKQRYDFSSLAGWPGSLNKGSASIRQGEYYSMDVPSGIGFSPSVINYAALDVRLRTDASLVKAADESQAVFGVMCRVQNDGSGMFMGIRGDGYGIIQKWDGSQLTPLTDWTYSDAINPGINANYVEGVCEGNFYSLYVNGVYVTQVENADFPIGKIGLGVVPGGSSANTQVDFDFVEVYDPLE